MRGIKYIWAMLSFPRKKIYCHYKLGCNIFQRGLEHFVEIECDFKTLNFQHFCSFFELGQGREISLKFFASFTLMRIALKKLFQPFPGLNLFFSCVFHWVNSEIRTMYFVSMMFLWTAFLSRFLGINSSLLRLEVLYGFLPSFFRSTKWYSWIDSSFLVSWIFLQGSLKPEKSMVFFKKTRVCS